MDRVRPRPVVFQVWLGCFAPDQIGEWGRRQATGGRHIAPAGNLVKTFRRSRQIPIPEDVDRHGLAHSRASSWETEADNFFQRSTDIVVLVLPAVFACIACATVSA